MVTRGDVVRAELMKIAYKKRGDSLATFGERLAELRKEADQHQEDIAGVLGVSTNTVSRWERGENKPDDDKVLFLSRYFHVSFSYLKGFSDDRIELVHSQDEEAVIRAEEQKQEEEHMLMLYRMLCPEMKAMIRNMINHAYLVEKDTGRLQP